MNQIDVLYVIKLLVIDIKNIVLMNVKIKIKLTH